MFYYMTSYNIIKNNIFNKNVIFIKYINEAATKK